MNRPRAHPPQNRDSGSYTRLERLLMDALSYDLRSQVPDLADQFRASTPTLRRNTGFGHFTEMLPPGPGFAASGLSGDFGSVHVMINGLPDPIAFRARLRDGALVGLLGDSYGQDTRHLDFSAARIDQVFIVDERGRSVSWEPQRAAPLPIPNPPSSPAASASPARPIAAQLKTAPVAPTVKEPTDAAASTVRSAPHLSDDALRSGLRVTIILVALAAVLLFDLSPLIALIVGFAAFRAVQTPAGLRLARRLIEALWARGSDPALFSPAGADRLGRMRSADIRLAPDRRPEQL
jgi:hypothetical protein